MRSLGSTLQRYSSAQPNPSSTDSNQPMGWRSLASNIGSSVKRVAKDAYAGGYDTLSVKVANLRGPNAETWNQWRERRREEAKGVEKLALFPGFAVKRLPYGNTTPNEFSIDIFVDGYASSLRPPEAATRTQKAFMRIARGFAALPKLPSADGVGDTMMPDIGDADSIKGDPNEDSDSESELYPEVVGHLPPRPDQMNDNLETAVLNRDPRYLSTKKSDPNLAQPDSSRRHNPAPSITSMVNLPHAELTRLHANLDARLQPFWSSVLTDRRVRISVFVSTHRVQADGIPPDGADVELKPTPIATRDVTTTLQGYFVHHFKIPFEDVCTHPAALDIAFGDPLTEHFLIVKAELLPVEPLATEVQDPSFERPTLAQSSSGKSINTIRPPPPPPRLLSSPSTSPSPYRLASASASSASLALLSTATMIVPITSAKVRLISDIDDTIKNTEVLGTFKMIYRNVFVKDMEDLIVPGMADWYGSLHQRGVRFHYVSNSPFELLPVIQEFLEVAGLPRGSVKLKYYGGRSILNGLWVGAGDKKRAGVLEILDHFPDSQFFLVGDSGEQDLELYAAIAAERPHQILGVFIRDVSSDDPTDPVAGFQSSGALDSAPEIPGTGLQSGRPALPPRSSSPSVATIPNGAPVATPLPYRPRTPSRRSTAMSNAPSPPPSPTNLLSGRYFDEPAYDVSQVVSGSAVQPRPYRPNTMSSTPHIPGGFDRPVPTHRSSSSASSLSYRKDSIDSVRAAQEKRRNDFRLRVEAARRMIPENIAFRIFKHPNECVETSHILDYLS